MNHSRREVLRYLTGHENIEAIALEDLKKLADENPYFPIVQLLLSKKLKAENNIAFLPQVQKTVLYFSNPFWLHYQLTEDEFLRDAISEENVSADKNIANSVGLTTELLKENKDTKASLPYPASEALSLDDAPHDPYAASEASAPLESLEEHTNIMSAGQDAELKTNDEENVSQPEEEMAALIPEPDRNTELFLEQIDDGVRGQQKNTEETVPEVDTLSQQNVATEVLEEMAGVSRQTDEATEAFLDETEIPAESNVEPWVHEVDAQEIQPENNPPVFNASTENKSDVNGEPDEHERMFQNIKAMLDATSEEADADTENAIVPIDPYYTIDYFASQGIKLELEQNPPDQLGQHLKKFTQWLKHMKKLGPEDATEVIARTETEADIQKIADSSNTVREVVTEAMASVLEKQGKKDKAVELYKKLSFLNPDKSAYFAGKIKNLKGT